ncbi:MAG: hypothetical protein SWX82_31860 [Cyanobacteriota bacterium]|nr:hypothetical protein [Cyanobacteriota bacterium]
MTQAVSSLSFAQKKTFLTEVFFNISIAFFVYWCVVCSVAQFKITEPLGKLLYENQTTTVISLVIYSVLCYLLYTLFSSKNDDLTQYFGYVGIICLRALWVSPFLILLVYEYSNVLKESFSMFITLIAFIVRMASLAVKLDKDFNFLAPIAEFGLVFVSVTGILGIIFGFDLGLLYILIAVSVYSLSLFLLGVWILKVDKNTLGSFEKGEELSASLFLFCMLEAIYIYIAIFLLIAFKKH